jgi:hypothetical protein
VAYKSKYENMSENRLTAEDVELREDIKKEFYEALKVSMFEKNMWVSEDYEGLLALDEAGDIILLSFCEQLFVTQYFSYRAGSYYLVNGKLKEQIIAFNINLTVKYLDADEIVTRLLFLGQIKISSVGREKLFKRVIAHVVKHDSFKLIEDFVAGDVSSLEYNKNTGNFSFNLSSDGVDLLGKITLEDK